jgi:hypothetical protein
MLLPETQIEQLGAQPPLLQLDIQASPGKAVSISERRSEQRTRLITAVLVVPMEGDVPDTSRAFTGIAKDVSEKGIGVVAHHFLMTPDVVICLWSDGEAKLLRAAVRHRKEVSRGWVRFGVEIIRMAEKNEYLELRRFIELMLKAQS